jgi:RND family efflux transporter MFP subunit
MSKLFTDPRAAVVRTAASAAAALVLFACSNEPAKPLERESVEAPTTIVEASILSANRAVAGTVRSENVSPLAAKVMGNIVRVLVSEGDRVSRGQLLVEIDAREGRAQTSAAASAVAAAQANAQLAESTYQRYASLRERSSVSEQELDGVKARRDAAHAELARVRSMGTQAQTFLDFSSVRSPIDGVVTARLVDPGAQAAPGMPLLIVEDARDLRVEATVPEELAVRAGDAVILQWTGGAHPATIERVQPSVDATTRASLVKIALGAAPADLRPGTYVRVLFKTGQRNAVIVPETAIVRRGSLTSVFVVGEDGVAHMRLVRLGENNEVLSGLDAGERVVTDPKNVRDGVKIV